MLKGFSTVRARLARDGLGTVRARLASFFVLAGNPFKNQAKKKSENLQILTWIIY